MTVANGEKVSSSAAYRADFLGLQALGAFINIKFDFLSGGQLFITVHFNRRKVRKDIQLHVLIRIDKPVTLYITKPLDCPGGHDSSSCL